MFSCSPTRWSGDQSAHEYGLIGKTIEIWFFIPQVVLDPSSWNADHRGIPAVHKRVTIIDDFQLSKQGARYERAANISTTTDASSNKSSSSHHYQCTHQHGVKNNARNVHEWPVLILAPQGTAIFQSIRWPWHEFRSISAIRYTLT